MKKSEYIATRALSLFTKPNKNAILLFGLNKSGTTVAINLISKRTGLTFFDDFPYHLGNFDKVLNKEISLTQYIDKYSHAFSKDIIRFPTQQHVLIQAREYFNITKYILVVRNPLDNIKSILSRLKIPGNLKTLNKSKLDIHPLWLRMLTQDENYLVSLANCWLQTYSQFDISDEKCVLFRYENFMEDKIKYVTKIVEDLDLTPSYPIDQFINIQYQPKGSHSNNLEFFGKDNKRKLESILLPIACKYGYTFENV